MKELKRIFEKRKSELTHLLKYHKSELSAEKQHQIYGAITEIDVFLKTIDFLINQQMESRKQELISYSFNNPDIKDKLKYLMK